MGSDTINTFFYKSCLTPLSSIILLILTTILHRRKTENLQCPVHDLAVEHRQPYI